MGRLTVTKSEIPFDEPVVADYERHPFHLIKGSTGTPEGGIKARLLTEEQVLDFLSYFYDYRHNLLRFLRFV